MIHIKKLKSNERIKIQAAEVLPYGKNAMLPMLLIGNYCITPMAKIIPKGSRPDPFKMAEFLTEWYQWTTDTFSEGIYSFVRKGRTKRVPGEPYYQYIQREIEHLISESSLQQDYADLFSVCYSMWTTGIEKYKDTFFWSYYYLHGDLHSGNIVNFRGKYHLIDWENLRSGPKETELSFYFIWDFLQNGENYRTLDDMLKEIDIFVQKSVITEQEKERILYCLIPMWMLIIVISLNNGSLRYAQERLTACKYIIPLYKEAIFEKRNWK